MAYLEDFFIIARCKAECQVAQLYLIKVLHLLEFSVNWKKLTSSTQRLEFLGLIVDLTLQRIELPEEKSQRICILAQEYLSRSKLTEKELQVLVGHLTFSSRVIYEARCFTNFFIDAMNSLSKAHNRIRLTVVLKFQLHWGISFAQEFNGLVHACSVPLACSL